jgi:hypothetical protein
MRPAAKIEGPTNRNEQHDCRQAKHHCNVARTIDGKTDKLSGEMISL